MGFQKSMAYQKAFALVMSIFESSKKFPKEEVYALTDQVRCSSRSVCSNLAEAYHKRRYVKHFISKLTDADGENSENQVWLQFAFECRSISAKNEKHLRTENQEIGKLLQYMINNPGKFGT